MGNDRWTKAKTKTKANADDKKPLSGVIRALQADLTRQEATSDEENLWKVVRERIAKYTWLLG